MVDPRATDAICEFLHEKNRKLSEDIDKISKEVALLTGELKRLEDEKAENIKILKLVESCESVLKQNLSEFDKILINEPWEALRKFSELYENKKIYDYAKSSLPFTKSFRYFSDNSKTEMSYIAFPRAGTSELIYLNLEDMTSQSVSIKWLQNLQLFGYTPIPGRKCLFFYGGYNTGLRQSTGRTFYLTDDQQIIDLPDGKPACDLAIIYHKDFVYALGGNNDKVSAKFNLELNKWEYLWPLPEGDYRESIITGYKNYILITARYLDKVIRYSIKNDYYADIQNLTLKGDAIKLLISSDDKVFVIELCGNIYQNINQSLKKWERVGRNDVLNCSIPTYTVRFRNNFIVSIWKISWLNLIWRKDHLK
ncbi:unnamed protein product [Blepharisma stoltei]|uniref:Uncharacterized protein n=1 Tax=Blepharisma stoltei TaxID=1481888 RepID=A0AAU9IWM2_9CILI|nr:unnamed protein product [Blepharisma stoltei]